MRLLLVIAIVLGCHPLLAAGPQGDLSEPDNSWQREVDFAVGRLGHRNMIIVADSAYPIQTGDGVHVIATAADHTLVLKHVFAAIERSRAVRPLIAVDKEFAFLPEEHAPGAASLRRSILDMVREKSAAPIREELHEVLLKEVNELATEYQVVVFKTTGTIPYSSVFLTLDCGYWSSEAEKALRARMVNED